MNYSSNTAQTTGFRGATAVSAAARILGLLLIIGLILLLGSTYGAGG